MKKFFHMNNDVPFEVLSRLSAKDLQELKCVCKDWESLISDRSFIRFQLKTTEPLSGFFFQENFLLDDYEINHNRYVSLESTKIHSTVFNFLPESVVLLTSCNGLICCHSCLPSPKPMLYVCNPLNKDWISLQWTNPSSASVALVFDPSQFPIGDTLTKFKVVNVSQAKTTEEKFEFGFDIYSSGTGNWEHSKETCQCRHDLSKNQGIFADDRLYWLTNGDDILMFDPDHELSGCVTMPLPFTEFGRIRKMCIGESNGKLHYVLLYEHGLQLWLLRDPLLSQWDLTSSISLKILEEENSFPILVTMFLAGIDLLSFKDDILFIRIGLHIYSYHFGTRKMKNLCMIFDLGNRWLVSPTVLPYSMSLAPVGVV